VLKATLKGCAAELSTSTLLFAAWSPGQEDNIMI
jgi:hypothetical protein